jgi:hypothetical protein
MDYLVSEWVLDSDGTPHVTLSSFKTHESALELYDAVKNKIKQESKKRQHIILQINSEEDYENYANNIDDYTIYVIEQSTDDTVSYYQDHGWKRPTGISLQKVAKSDDSENPDLNWQITSGYLGLSTYPISHGGQW